MLGLLACLAAFLAAGCSGGADERPNIVFVLADDLDYAATRRLPALDTLFLEQGASFEKAFVNLPQCCPSRATILTGLYAHNHGVKRNDPPDGGFEKFLSEGLEEETIAVRLQEGGYRTALFGKYLNGYLSEYPDDPIHVPPGWDEWYGKPDEGGQEQWYHYKINEGGRMVAYGGDAEDYYTDVLSRQATGFVRRAASEDQPFFAYVAPTAPHEPVTPAERHEGAFAGETSRPPSFNEEDVSDKPGQVENEDLLSDEEIEKIDRDYRGRLESMLAVEEMVASLVEELEAAGELENTFIFFTSDNGFQQGEHRLGFGKNRVYEESVHVPLFVRGPGVPAGTSVEQLVLNTDFAPTFAELAGIESLSDGRSFAPLLRGEDPPWRSSIFLEGGLVEEGSPESGGRESSRRTFNAIRTETHKYVEYGGRREERELYDLRVDPYELENVYETADPFLVEDLEARLDALRSCAGDGCREAEDAS